MLNPSTPIPPAGAPERRPELVVLNQLQIVSPCHMAWDGMTGTDRERHCASCCKTVHNLIEHSADEALRLVTEPGARVCVRVHRDAAGNVLTKDTLPKPGPTRRGVLERLAWLAASWLGLNALAGCNRTSTGEAPPMTGVAPPISGGSPLLSGGKAELTMGDVCPPSNAMLGKVSSTGTATPKPMPSPTVPSMPGPNPAPTSPLGK